MGRLSAAVLTCCTLGTWWAPGAALAQTAPDSLLGTFEGNYILVTPADAAKAGLPAQAGNAGECLTTNGTALAWGTCGSVADASVTAFQFFAQETLAVPTIASTTNIGASGVTQTWLAEKTYSQGLIIGPFFTSYEGTLNFDTGTTTNIRSFRTTVSVKHTFADGKTLTTEREHVRSIRRNSIGVTPLTSFSSITNLQLGNVTADDGSTIAITAALLKQPVKIAISATYHYLGSGGSPVTAALDDLDSQNAKVTFWQLNRTNPADISLSDATPTALGTAAAGSASAASRGDHVHPLTGVPVPSTATPKVETVSGTAGSAAAWSRGDHAHPARLRLSTTTPEPPTASGDEGKLGTVSRGDHAHPQEFPRPSASNTCLRSPDGTAVAWGTCGGSRPFATGTPKSVGTSNQTGSATTVPRADHVHSVLNVLSSTNADLPVSPGPPSVGSRPSAARSDHRHPAVLPVPQRSDAGKAVRINLSGNAYETRSVGDLVEDGLPTLTGKGGNVLTVNPAGTGYSFEPVFPSLTGHAGNMLTVNAGATGVEWKAGGAGGGGGAWTSIWSGTLPSNGVVQINATSTTAVNLRAEVNNPSNEWRVRLVDQVSAGLSRESVCPFGSIATAHTGGSDYTVMFKGAGLSPNDNTDLRIVTCIMIAEVDEDRSDRFDTPYLYVRMREFGSSTTFSGWTDTTFNVEYRGGGGGGGGGSSGPSIPTPTAAGALKLLRVNAAGAAYELSDPPDIASISDEVDAVQRATSDLSPYPSSDDPTFVNNLSAANAKVAFIADTDSTPSLSGVSFNRADPGAHAGERGYFLVAVATGHDKARYRLRFTSSGGEPWEFPGNTWQSITPSAGAESGFAYWAATPVGEVIGGVATVRLQGAANENHVGQTSYAGDPTVVSAWAKAGLGNGEAGEVLGMNAGGTGPKWTAPLTLQSTGTPGSDTWPGERGSGGQASRWDHRHATGTRIYTALSGTETGNFNDNFLKIGAASTANNEMVADPFRIAGWTVTELILWMEWPDNDTIFRFGLRGPAVIPGSAKLGAGVTSVFEFYFGYVNSSINGAHFTLWGDGSYRLELEKFISHGNRTIKWRLDYVLTED